MFLRLWIVQIFVKAMPRGKRCAGIVQSLLAGRRGVRSLLILFFSGAANILFAQQPVQITTVLRPPYTLQLSDYYASTQEKLIVTLLNRDLHKPTLNVRLRMTIESQSVQLRTREFAILPTLQLEAGIPLRLSLGDLAPYFSTENLDFSGMTRAQYAQHAKLPEGFYQFCFEAIELSTNQVASAKSCAMAWMSLSDPPFLNVPRKGESIALKEPQNIIFQWTPRNLNSPNTAYSTEYDFQLVEFWDNSLAPEVAFQSMQPLYEATTRTTTLLYGPSQPLLIPGKRYGWRIKAHAKSGTEEVDAFRNQGFSEIYWFTYQDVCPAPQNISATPGSFGSLEFSWTPSEKHKSYMVTYRIKDKEGATWFDQQASTPLALVYDVEPGIEYEYRVGAFCTTDQPVFAELRTIKVPARETESFANCTIVPNPNITNKQQLQTLKAGDVITAGDFPVKLKEVSGSGSFTGKGYVIVPFLGKAKVSVKFDNIQVNTQNQLIAGEVITTYNEKESGIADTDELEDIFRGYEGIVSRLKDFTVNSNTDDLVKVADKITGNATKELPADEADAVKKNVTELVAAKKEYDEAKKAYDQLGDDDSKKEEAKKKVDELEQKFDEIKNRFEGKDSNAVTTQKYTIEFARAKNSNYGFDKINPLYRPTLDGNYDFIQKESGAESIPWKAVAQGEYDWVKVSPAERGNTVPQDIAFRSTTGSISSTIKGDELTVKVFGYAAGEKTEVVAYQKKDIDGKEVNVELGKVNVVSYAKVSNKVIIVPVNNTPVPYSAEQIKAGLDTIYSQAVVSWSVEVKESFSSDYDANNNGLDDGDSEMLSNYTVEMNAIIDGYKQRNKINDDTYYLFIVPRSESGKALGYLPLAREMGFIFTDKAKGNLFIKTIAHELGHGAFHLKHTFEAYPALGEGTTDNLMDYASGVNLNKYQWDLIHNPEFVVPLFQSDESGSYKSWTNLQGDLIENIPGYITNEKSFLSLTGDLITLPADARDFTFYNGYLAAFTIGQERYIELHNAATRISLGYFFNAKEASTKGNFTLSANTTPYPGVVATSPLVFYALKKNECGKLEIFKAKYKLNYSGVNNGGINKSTDFYNTNTISAASQILEDYSSLGTVQSDINCLDGRAKELYKFIVDHYAQNGITLTDQDKSELITQLRKFNSVLIKGLDQLFNEKAESIKIREMLKYGYTEFLANLKEKTATLADGSNNILIVEFQDLDQIRDAYLVYQIAKKTGAGCEAAQKFVETLDKMTTMPAEFNLQVIGSIINGNYQRDLAHDVFGMVNCLLEKLKVPESVYNPNRLDNKIQALYQRIFEDVLAIDAGSMTAGIFMTPANYEFACSCGLWNSVVDVVEGIPSLGEAVTQDPVVLLQSAKAAYAKLHAAGFSSLGTDVLKMLKQHHGIVNGYGVDSYQATYGMCYDAVFVLSFFVGLEEIKLASIAAKSGDLGEAGRIIYSAAKAYPGTIKDLVKAIAKLPNDAARKVLLEIIQKVPIDKVTVSLRNGVNSIILSTAMQVEIARFSEKGLEIVAPASDAILNTGKIIYQSTDELTDVAGKNIGKLVLVEDESGKVLALAKTVGKTIDDLPTAIKDIVSKFPDEASKTTFVSQYFDGASEVFKKAIDTNPKLVDSWKVLYDAGLDNVIRKDVDNLNGVSKHLDKSVHSANDIKTGLNSATDKQKWLDDLKDGVYRNGNKAEYINPSGNVLKWTDQDSKSILQSIESALKSSDPGKLVEGRIGDFVKKQGKEIEGFGLKIQNSTTGQTAGDIDVMTKKAIIEVKKSASSFKEGQVDKFTNPSMANFLNSNNRRAILYIDEALTEAQRVKILSQIPNNVTLVNSLDELAKILN